MSRAGRAVGNWDYALNLAVASTHLLKMMTPELHAIQILRCGEQR